MKLKLGNEVSPKVHPKMWTFYVGPVTGSLLESLHVDARIAARTNFGWQNVTQLTTFPIIDKNSLTNFSGAWANAAKPR